MLNLSILNFLYYMNFKVGIVLNFAHFQTIVLMKKECYNVRSNNCGG